MEETEIVIKIPLSLKKKLEESTIDINEAVSTALQGLLQKNAVLDVYSEVTLREKDPRTFKSSDVPPSSFLHIPGLTLEQYEAIVDDTSWEYLDGNLFHHSPESNIHNAILNFLNYRALTSLDPALFIIRTSRVALSINQDKPQPDFMVFNKDDFRKTRRIDGTESEIIESAPLLVIEIVSGSSIEIDDQKTEKYLSKGVKEYWRIYCHVQPLKVIACTLRKGAYEQSSYTKGEIRARIVPDFAITFEDLLNPDSAR
jgi:Uma2 family endonuclease